MLKPSKISVSQSSQMLIIDWENGEQSHYPLAGLRSACPCAECRGGHENMGQAGSPEMLEIPLTDVRSSELERVDLVGNYALQITWKDGHSYGIYTWEFLHDLSPGHPRESEFE
jgi:DUF971 family protein